jgi:hypothetical protein
MVESSHNKHQSAMVITFNATQRQSTSLRLLTLGHAVTMEQGRYAGRRHPSPSLWSTTTERALNNSR